MRKCSQNSHIKHEILVKVARVRQDILMKLWTKMSHSYSIYVQYTEPKSKLRLIKIHTHAHQFMMKIATLRQQCLFTQTSNLPAPATY